MFGDGDDRRVTCIACGTELSRSDAREYDKYGNRWDREGKRFEYLCKQCDRNRSHQPRRGLEATLVECQADELDRDAFLAAFCETAEDRTAGTR